MIGTGCIPFFKEMLVEGGSQKSYSYKKNRDLTYTEQSGGRSLIGKVMSRSSEHPKVLLAGLTEGRVTTNNTTTVSGNNNELQLINVQSTRLDRINKKLQNFCKNCYFSDSCFFLLNEKHERDVSFVSSRRRRRRRRRSS